MKIVTREEWGAEPPRKVSSIPLPAPELWLHHTVSLYRGPAGMRKLQLDHFARGFRDVGYPIVIDSLTLKVYEGAGIGVLAAHTKGHNRTGQAIALTGNYENREVSPELIARIAEVVAYGHEQGWWAQPQLTGGHRDVRSTLCPGDNLYKAIPAINEMAANWNKEATMDIEDAQILVTSLYERVLGRGADEAGWNYWTNLLGSGKATEAQVRWEFMFVALEELRIRDAALAEHASSGSGAPAEAVVRAAIADYHAELLQALDGVVSE
jgi:hypothetical protein